MACSKYQYVKKFEQHSTSLLQTYIVVRIDGRAFTKFCNHHNFQKPNDLRAIKLMQCAAQFVCQNFMDIILAFGQSDEYSFAFNKNTTLFGRRTDKILSCVVSAFTGSYVFNWNKYFEGPLLDVPIFDSRIVTYPNEQTLKDYFRWRQVDCHINNLYNTAFWCLVKSGKTNQEVQMFLKDTNSAQKNELLFSQFNINYNKIDKVYRRGTFLLYQTQCEKQKMEDHVEEAKQQPKLQIGVNNRQEKIQESKKGQNQTGKKAAGKKVVKAKRNLVTSHQDCIKQQFWTFLQK